jgi:hypothetical protein
MTIPAPIVKEIITKVLNASDYRIHVVSLINAEFLSFAIDFFKKVVKAKLDAKDITIEWYKKAFMNSSTTAEEYAINAGLNRKTIHNMYRSSKRQIVITASNEHFDDLYNSIQSLVESDPEIDLTLTIKFRGVSVDLNVSESLIVINTLAVKRAALRGGAWSTVGKRVEKHLMLSLCKLYQVGDAYYNAEHFVRAHVEDVEREIDFYLKNNGHEYKCEVKLMGQGNPESADAIIARDTNVFVADTLSDQNKAQCDQLGVHWIACRDDNGFKRFGTVLSQLGIPHVDYNGDLNTDLPRIFAEIF